MFSSIFYNNLKRLFFFLFFISFIQLGFAEEKSQPQEWAWGPPLIYPGPFFNGYVTDFDTVSVEFKRAVIGFKAEDLTVNGSPATGITQFTKVNEDRRVCYFIGFRPPSLGKVEIVLKPGHIKDEKTGVPFNGVTVTRFLFDLNVDDDQDGLSNGEEINKFLSDPTKADTDNDGIPDGAEIKYSCLNVIIDETSPQDNYGVETPGNPDFDSDGVSNVDEFKQGTDPCVANKK